MSKLRIYGVARTRAFRALWMAEELGLDYEHVPLEIGAAGARKQDYLALNPNGRLPAIDVDGFVLWESLAITLYLAKKHGRVYPASLEGEAKAWQWSFWAVQEVDRGVNIWSLHAVRLPPADRDPQRLAEALKVLAPPFKVLDAALASHSHLLGEDFTVADLNVAAVISRAIDMDLSATPHVAQWLSRCLERPAARTARAMRAKADATTPVEVVQADCPAQPFVRRAWARVNEERAMAKRSAGILMFRHRGRGIEVLLMHPGGPFWAKKDAGAWSIPKGEYAEGEDALTVAQREFEEETGARPHGDFLPLGEIVQAGRKIVTAWALEGDFDPAILISNRFDLEWPPKSGRKTSFPEVDRAQWFSPVDARQKLLPAQRELITRLLDAIA